MTTNQGEQELESAAWLRRRIRDHTNDLDRYIQREKLDSGQSASLSVILSTMRDTMAGIEGSGVTAMIDTDGLATLNQARETEGLGPVRPI